VRTSRPCNLAGLLGCPWWITLRVTSGKCAPGWRIVRIARVLFVVDAMKAVPVGAGAVMVLLHGFIKKERKTPKPDLDLAKDRLKRMRGTK